MSVPKLPPNAARELARKLYPEDPDLMVSLLSEPFLLMDMSSTFGVSSHHRLSLCSTLFNPPVLYSLLCSRASRYARLALSRVKWPIWPAPPTWPPCARSASAP